MEATRKLVSHMHEWGMALKEYYCYECRFKIESRIANEDDIRILCIEGHKEFGSDLKEVLKTIRKINVKLIHIKTKHELWLNER
jgi:hypothetical protein